MGEGRKDGGPAFPSSADFIDPQNMGWVGGGMSLRDWFAGQALPTLLDTCRGDNRGVSFVDHVAQQSYAIADAMLAARRPTPAAEGGE